MKNYKLIIQYKGTNYSGWQIQQNSDSVQQRITAVLNTLLKEEINLIGSGRTDTGVHALGQAANFRTEKEIDIYKFQYSLNSLLPSDISIIKMNKTEENFHARFDAKKRSYIYLISKYKSPFYEAYSFHYNGNTAVDSLNQLSKFLIREDDFSSFCKKNYEVENKDCIIYNVAWRETKGIVIFFIEANRFLRGMVRTITGTLLNAVKNNFNEKYLEEILQAKDRETAAEAVPAKGLFLYKVKY